MYPVALPSLGSSVSFISCGAFHSCAISSTGELFCWGRNVDGQIPGGSGPTRSVPGKISFAQNVTAVSAGYAHTCYTFSPSGGGISSNQIVMCSGRIAFGDSPSGRFKTNPTDVKFCRSVQFSSTSNRVQADSCRATLQGLVVTCRGFIPSMEAISTSIDFLGKKYVTTSNASIFVDADECVAGTHSCSASSGGSCVNTLGSFNCSLCYAGYYLAGNASCLSCLSGYYCAGANAAPAACSEGTFSSTGASSCAPCTAGLYSLLAASSCAPCPAGRFCLQATTSSLGSGPCPPGSFSTVGSGATPACSPCPAGRYCLLGCASASGDGSCPAGSYSEQGTGVVSSCIPCPAGRYCLAGTATVSGSGLCAPGAYSELGTGLNASCTLCPAGRYCLEGTASSAGSGPCPTGSYSELGTGTAPSCTSCPEGTHSPMIGSPSKCACSVCAIGTFCPAASDAGKNCVTNSP